MLTHDEILLLLELLSEKHGPGYAAEDQKVAKLQAKLSIMLEAAAKVEVAKADD